MASFISFMGSCVLQDFIFDEKDKERFIEHFVLRCAHLSQVHQLERFMSYAETGKVHSFVDYPSREKEKAILKREMRNDKEVGTG